MGDYTDTYKTKSGAIAVALLMAIAAAGLAALCIEDSDAAGTATGEYQVFFKGSGDSSFSSTIVNAYDGYQAVVAAGSTLNYAVHTATGNDTWSVIVNSGSSTYLDCNINYGTLASIDEITGTGDNQTTTNYDISNYHIYAYCTETTTTTTVVTPTSGDATTTKSAANEEGWYDALDALGWMHPYEDYSAYFTGSTTTDSSTDETTGTVTTVTVSITYSLAVANIAICYGTDSATDLESISPDDVLDLTGIERYTLNDDNSAVKDDGMVYSFTISGNGLIAFSAVGVTEKTDGLYTSATIPGGTSIDSTVIYGWGSNAYEALKDALGSSNVVGQEEYAVLHTNADGSTYYTYYSWMSTILGNGTYSDIGSNYSTYKYWSTDTIASDGTTSYCSFTLGYYSTEGGAQNDNGDFKLEYLTSTYYF